MQFIVRGHARHREDGWSRVALLCAVSHCAQNPFSAASIAAATDAAWSAGKCGRARLLPQRPAINRRPRV